MTDSFTVRELIEFLQTVPQEAEVSVVRFSEGSGYGGGHATHVPMSLSRAIWVDAVPGFKPRVEIGVCD